MINELSTLLHWSQVLLWVHPTSVNKIKSTTAIDDEASSGIDEGPFFVLFIHSELVVHSEFNGNNKSELPFTVIHRVRNVKRPESHEFSSLKRRH